MDPATIGFLISLAPTVLQLLFGEGTKKFPSSNKMLYGHGRKKKHARGGYVYPEITDEKSQKKWFAAYQLNKQLAENNPWLAFLKSKMPELKKEYNKLQKHEVETAAEGKGAKHKRKLKKISPSVVKELEGLNEEDLIKLYHGKALYGHGDGLYGYGRVSYKALAHAEALKKGVKLPKSAKSVGKTWKQIYHELSK